MNKKLNNFNQGSTHYAVGDKGYKNKKGELKYLTLDVDRAKLTGEKNIIKDAEEIERKLGLQKALEFYKYKF